MTGSERLMHKWCLEMFRSGRDKSYLLRANVRNKNVLRACGKRGFPLNVAAPFSYPPTTYFHPNVVPPLVAPAFPTTNSTSTPSSLGSEGVKVCSASLTRFVQALSHPAVFTWSGVIDACCPGEGGEGDAKAVATKRIKPSLPAVGAHLNREPTPPILYRRPFQSHAHVDIKEFPEGGNR